MAQFRAYRNTDSPALVALWARSAPARNAVRIMMVHEFDALIPGKLHFDRHGLIVAEDEQGLIGFVHAGFGPEEPAGPSHRLDTSMGAVVMLILDPARGTPEIADGLMAEGIRYLRERGARVIYAGGRYPVNPYYWGIYGGSEFAGILDDHDEFHQAAQRSGFEQAGTTVLFEAPLSEPEPRDVRFSIVRKHYRVEIEEDATMPAWWDSLALGLFRPTRLQLVDRQTGLCRATAWTWEIAPGMAAEDGLARTALIDLEVHPECRRRGLGRTLVMECFRHARECRADVLCVQTSATNEIALSLYQDLGFEMVEHATLYRLPGSE